MPGTRENNGFYALLRPPVAEGIDIIGSVGDQAEQRSSCLGLDPKPIPKRCRGADRGLSADAGDGLADPSRSGLGAEAAPAAFEDQICLFILGMPAHTVPQRGRQIRVRHLCIQMPQSRLLAAECSFPCSNGPRTCLFAAP